jgi:ketosteroid isomerase-like protein
LNGEANKRVIREYFEKMAAGSPEVPDLFTDDVTWWVPQSSALGGTYEGRDAVLGLMGSGVDLYDTSVPLQIDVEEMVAEGDQVCVQLVIRARTAAGEDYENHYHFAFRLRGGKICAVKEYVDTLYAERMLFSGRGA